MSTLFCVNCGKTYNPPIPLCPGCNSEPEIPNEIIDTELNRRRTVGVRKPLNFSCYPGEKASLMMAISIIMTLVAVLGVISFGMVILLILINLFLIKADHIASRGGMLPVNDRSYSVLHRISKVSAYRLGIPLPEVYVTQNPDYNAYTKGFYKYGFIVMNSGMVQDLAPDEILFVLGHEMGHMGLYHTSWLSLMAPGMSMGTTFIAAPVMRVIFNVWSVKAEYSADRAGLVACKNVLSVVRCLLKLAGGVGADSHVELPDILSIKRSEREDIIEGLTEYLGTHPFIKNRIKMLLLYK